MVIYCMLYQKSYSRIAIAHLIVFWERCIHQVRYYSISITVGPPTTIVPNKVGKPNIINYAMHIGLQPRVGRYDTSICKKLV